LPILSNSQNPTRMMKILTFILLTRFTNELLKF